MSVKPLQKSKHEEAESEEKKLRYPRSVFFIVGNEFCERFSYYGMKAILSIYLKKKLHFTEDKATVVYHTFSMFCYFTPIFGALLADLLLGKFKTIVYISVLYVLGHLLKTIAAVPDIGIPPVEFTLIGLALIALGTGGIKPCVSALGGDQFKLPEQTRQLQSFFSVFYFAINAGSLISTILTPKIRQEVHCFGDDSCYSLAFGIPAILMFVATLIIILGNFCTPYVMKPPQGNILVQVFGSIGYALRKKIKGEKAPHWLDLAAPKYGTKMVEDIKCLLRILIIYIPLPIFWALFDQSGSRWTFQASRMNGQFGNFTIAPEQIQVFNPILVLILIPIFDRIIYPVFAKFGLLVKPLQRMTVGGILTAGSFFIAGFLELEMDKTYAKIPGEDISHVYFMNSLPCNITVQMENENYFDEFSVPELGSFVKYELPPANYTARIEVDSTCLPSILNIRSTEVQVTGASEAVSTVLVSADGGSLRAVALDLPEEPEKDDSSAGRARLVLDLVNLGELTDDLYLVGGKRINFTLNETETIQQLNYFKMDIGDYRVEMANQSIGDIHVHQGGVYTILLHKNVESEHVESVQFTLTQPNKINIFWMFPQYFVVTLGEIMVSITGLEFSYSQAPESMKSVLQAAWLLTVAFGNIIVIFVALAKGFSRAGEFFMFAVLMVVDIILFALLAWWYTPRDPRETDIKLETTEGVPNHTFSNDEL